MKTLIIAEKPSVAKDLAKAIRVPAKGDNIYENDEYVISSAVGHLVELFNPEEYDSKLSRWSRKTLPIIPEKFQLRPSAEKGAKEAFLKLRKLLARADVGTVVNGCDAGREGELIFFYIYELAGCRLPVKRLWLTSMTPAAMRDGIGNLRDGAEMVNLRAAARSRAESDWLIGMNGTRAVTLRTTSGKGKVSTVGRVQTPTLSLIVQRELDIRGFVPKTYWRIAAEFLVSAGRYEGIYQKEDSKKAVPAAGADGNAENPDERADRIWDKALAEKIFAACKKCSAGTVSEEKKRREEAAPRLYDLTTLQREANKRFGFPATKTLQIAQALYEKYKATTYPRTDSRALPEDYMPTCRNTLAALAPTRFGKFSEKVLANDWVRPNRRIFNNKEISDHFAIIPTDSAPAGTLSPDEAKIYEMVVNRFIAVFFPPAKYDVTTRFTTLAGTHRFKTEGKLLVEAGWKEVYGHDEKTAEETLPPLSPGDRGNAKVLRLQLQEESTKPPSRYTEATLLAAMESAGKLVADEELAEAMKERGLGTPATRAGIIDHLIRTKYVERASRELVPTLKAEQLVAFLKVAGVEYLTSPAMTGEWEYKLRQVSEGKLSRAEFMSGIVALTRQIVEGVNGGGSDDQWSETSVISPTDGRPMLENFKMFRSQDSVPVGKGREYPALVVFKNTGGHAVTAEEVATLVANGEAGPFDDFKSRFGKKFSAKLKLEKNESGLLRTAFVFPPREGDAEANVPADFTNAPIVGVDPVTKCNVYATNVGFSVNPAEVPASAKKLKAFSMKKTLLGLELPREQIEKLLRDGKTDVLRGFTSNRTKRKFDATLTLRSDGKLGWQFPPREPKAKTGDASLAGTAKKSPARGGRKILKKAEALGVKTIVPAGTAAKAHSLAKTAKPRRKSASAAESGNDFGIASE